MGNVTTQDPITTMPNPCKELPTEFDLIPALGRVVVQADGDVLRFNVGYLQHTALRLHDLARELTYKLLRSSPVFFSIEVAEPEFVKEKISILHEEGHWRRLVLSIPVTPHAVYKTDIPGPFAIAVHQRGNALGLMVERKL